MALDEDAVAAAACEPQQDDDLDYGGDGHAESEEDLGLDLLARARLLCQAANEIALPMLRTVQQLQAKKPSPPKARKPANKTSRPSTREEDEPSTSQPRQKNSSKTDGVKRSSRTKSRENPQPGQAAKLPDTLPPIAAAVSLPAATLPAKKVKALAKPVAQTKKKKKEEEEAEPAMPLPQINATDEWRKQREVEKIRQAQERAKARVLRKTNHVDALPAKSNQHADADSGRPHSSESAKEDALGQIEANRRRALERVKLRKLELAEEQARAAAAKQQEEMAVQQPSDERVKKTEAFRHRTLQRLQAAKREAQAQDSQSAAAEAEKNSWEPQEDPEEKENERKRLAKHRRRETAERLKRQQQIAEEQQRKEQELFEKGLNDFKTKKKEQDRVAKGLAPKRPSSADPVVVFEPEETEPSSPRALATVQSNSLPERREQLPPLAAIVGMEPTGDVDQDPSEGLSLSIPTTEHDTPHDTVHVASSDTTSSRPRPKKVPSWKQPPVPILPAECYTQKAMASPSDSYSERFQVRTGRTSPTVVPDATFSPLHAQKPRLGRAKLVNNQSTVRDHGSSSPEDAATL